VVREIVLVVVGLFVWIVADLMRLGLEHVSWPFLSAFTLELILEHWNGGRLKAIINSVDLDLESDEHIPSNKRWVDVVIEALRPLDEHNRELRDNVPPPQWTNRTPSGRYNLVVIGAGAAGLARIVFQTTEHPARRSRNQIRSGDD